MTFLAGLPEDQVGTLHTLTAGSALRVLSRLAVEEEAVRVCNGFYDGVTVFLMLSFVVIHAHTDVGGMIVQTDKAYCS